MSAMILRQTERVSRPWQNGVGTTTEVAIYPLTASATDFDWRVSIAAVDSDSRFSSFAGVDRWLMPISVGGLVLRDASGRHPVAQFDTFEFAGEAEVEAVEVDHRCLDLNLMTRRDRATGTLSSARVDGSREFDAGVVVVVLEGRLDIDGEALGALDGAMTERGTVARGSALVAVAAVRSARQT